MCACADAQALLPSFLLDVNDAGSAESSTAALSPAPPTGASTSTASTKDPHQERLLRLGLIGVPNAGKSTLTNWLVGGTVSAVSVRPETTRRAALGAFNDGNAQVRCPLHLQIMAHALKDLGLHKLASTLRLSNV